MDRLGLRLTLRSGKEPFVRLLVTHDARVAAYADREVMVRDGTVINRAEVQADAQADAQVEVSR